MATDTGNAIGGSENGNGVNPAGTTKSRFSPDAAPFVVDPAAVTGNTDTGHGGTAGEPKRRGRKPGSTNKPRTATAQQGSAVDKNALRDLILFAHTILLESTKIQEFKMEAAEAEVIAAASVNVLRHYDIGQQSQKAMDWIALIGAVGMVYGTRAIAYRTRTAKPRQGNVQQIRPVVS